MAPPLKWHESTIHLIESVQLTPTEHRLWRTFLAEAVDSEYAAQYVWERIHDNSGRPVEQTLQELKLDWKRVTAKLTKRDKVLSEARTLVEERDNAHCFMLDQKPDSSVPVRFDHAWVIPPSLFDDSDMDPQGSLYALLQAFLTPAELSKLQNLLQTQEPECQLKNLLLLSPSVHSAFRRGRIQVFPITDTGGRWDDEMEARIQSATRVNYFVGRQSPEPCDGLFLSDGSPWSQPMQMFIMETQNPNLPLPDPFLVRMHDRIAASQHLFYVEEQIAEGWPSPGLFQLSGPAQKKLRSLWYLVPKFIRVQCYRVLLKVGSYLYPRPSGLVQPLPFGLYAKEGNRSTRNEAAALRLVEQYTSLPAPLWVDEYQGSTYPVFIMTEMPGQPLDTILHRLSYSERKQLSKDLKNFISQLQYVPNQSSYLFVGSHGGPMYDRRFPSGTPGPFHKISEFNDFLVHRCVGEETKDKIAAVHSRQYRSVFTHADLHPSNILIERGRLSAIVDWECAGFFPEYWEFTKLMYGAERYPVVEIIRDAFKEKDYQREFEAERQLWYDTPFGI